jgi:hypothetical protein
MKCIRMCERKDKNYSNEICGSLIGVGEWRLQSFGIRFPMQYVTNNISNNHWITTGIKVSCKRKQYLYIMSKTPTVLKLMYIIFNIAEC